MRGGHRAAQALLVCLVAFLGLVYTPVSAAAVSPASGTALTTLVGGSRVVLSTVGDAACLGNHAQPSGQVQHHGPPALVAEPAAPAEPGEPPAPARPGVSPALSAHEPDPCSGRDPPRLARL